MEIIDFNRKGNVVRLYLGKKDPNWGYTNKDYKDYTGETPSWIKPSDKYYGDDWNDTPYQHNAGTVYEEFVKGWVDIAFKFDINLKEPADDEYSGTNHSYSKDTLIEKRLPILVAAKAKDGSEMQPYDYDGYHTLAFSPDADVLKIHFGDDIQKILKNEKASEYFTVLKSKIIVKDVLPSEKER